MGAMSPGETLGTLCAGYFLVSLSPPLLPPPPPPSLSLLSRLSLSLSRARALSLSSDQAVRHLNSTTIMQVLEEEEQEEQEEEEESLFKADAVNEEDSERDRATQVGGGGVGRVAQCP